MPFVRMWPPSDGSRNAISFAGRTYSSTPGVAVNVESFDVAVLEANGWTRYATLAGQTNVTMRLPDNSKRSAITISGRTYNSQPGNLISVPEFDAPILEANGFLLVQQQETSGEAPVNITPPSISGMAEVGSTLTASPGIWDNSPESFTYQWKRNGVNIDGATASTYVPAVADQGLTLSIAVTAWNSAGMSSAAASSATSAVISAFAAVTPPAGALGIWSVLRTAGWNGNCLRVRRASDNAEQDIGFAGNVVDWPAADAFAGGSNLFVTKWYDQSGNGADLTQAALANQPVFARASHWNGIRGVTADQQNGSFGTGPKFLQNAALNFNANASTVYIVSSSRLSYGSTSYFQMQSAGPVHLQSLYHADTSLRVFRGGGSYDTLKFERSQMTSIAVAFNGSGGTIDFDGTQASIGNSTNSTVTIFNLGSSADAFGGNFYGDYFFVALYGTAHTPQALGANRQALASAFAVAPYQSKRAVFAGDSLVTGTKGTNAQSVPWVAGFGRLPADDGYYSMNALPDWDVFCLARAGKTGASELSGIATYMRAYDLAVPLSVYITNSFTNDMSSTTYTSVANAQSSVSNLYNNTLLQIVSTARTQGFNKVVVPTCIGRNDFQLGTGNFKEDARLYWNSLVRNGAAANNYTVSDRAAHPALADAAAAGNPVYYSDGIHLTNTGYTVMAAIDRTAVLG
ncbi:MAG TPA: arabinofuranosidase catalytic domain-containing protein [Methylocella sp.]|nr:arabinofuranosidase catalytic domain-containing protein [Methylocella sp.]